MKIIRAQYRFGPFSFDAARGDLRRDGDRVPAGAQALALLAALLGQAGALVTKDDLLQAAWPGLTVEEGNISVQVHRLRQLLEDAKRPHRWIATEPGRGYRFIGPVERDSTPAPVQPAPAGAAEHQAAIPPPSAGPMVGRERELSALLAMMPGHRLVTITGPGGMGKTRLAMEFALENATDPLNRVLFLGLEGLRQRDQIVFRVAAQLGLQPSEGPRSARDLAARMRNDPHVLILDNCEHVLEEAAGLAEIVLAHAPGVSILATSREPLRLPNERILVLDPLECPGPAAPETIAELGFYAAVRLFSQNAAISDPAFRLDDDTAPIVAAICRKVEGIPLALQLAASRLRGMQLPALLAGLSAPRRLPAMALPGAPARHRTVEATIAWSVALLSDSERAALRRLSIFAPDFNISAAQQVIAGGSIAAADVADFVTMLLDKSLLVRQPPGKAGQARFRLPESTRHFALDMLAEAGELNGLRENLARYAAAIFGQAREDWAVTPSGAWLAAYAPEIENLRAALDWAFSPDGNDAMRVTLAARLRAPFADRLITLREHSAAIRAAVPALTPDTPAEDAGWVWFSASYEPSPGLGAHGATSSKAVAAFQEAGNLPLAGFAAARSAVLFSLAGNLEQAEHHIARALAALPNIPANRYRSAILLNIATSFAMRNADDQLNRAMTYYAEALPIAQRFNDRSQMALIGANHAEVEAMRGDYAAAIARSQTLVAESRTRRDERRLNHDLTNLLVYSLLAGDMPAARQAALEVIPLLLDFEDQHWGTDHGCMFAMLAAAAGAWRSAALLAGFSRHYHEVHDMTRGIIEARLLDKLNAGFKDAAVAKRLSEAERMSIMDEGARISFAEALRLAQTI
jgi:predicted ATPase/DNA-binding winged helix-turn-helix (wHTH) protein